MKTSHLASMVLPVLVTMSASAFTVSAQDSPAHRHMGHVADGFSNTPEGQGLLPIALSEAAAAAQHTGLALQDTNDLASMQRHAGHVLHALDPSRMDQGPGAGYGVVPAAGGVVRHIEMAGADESASENVATHATHVAAAARGATQRAERAATLAKKIIAATSVEHAASILTELDEVIDHMVRGRDANGDGRIGWQQAEGGLAQAEQHMNLMKRGEAKDWGAKPNDRGA